MKQTLITRLILTAFAGLAAVGANAGQIQSSSTSIAREVITNMGSPASIANDTEAIASPTASYRFAGDVDARSQDQVFQVQFTLNASSNGAAPMWGPLLSDGATAASAIADSIAITDGITSTLLDQGGDYVVVAAGRSPVIAGTTGSATVWATIKVLNVPGGTAVLGTAPGTTASLVKQPLISINASSNLVAGGIVNPTKRNTIIGLASVVGNLVTDYDTTKPPTLVRSSTGATMPTCARTITDGISFKHFTAVTDPTSMVTGGVGTANPGNEDESSPARGGTNTQGGWLVFPTNVKVNIATPVIQNAGIKSGGNLQFVDTTGAGISATSSYQAPLFAQLGTFALTSIGAGNDTDSISQYFSLIPATLLTPIATTATNVGNMEAHAVTIRVYATNGFSLGGTVFADTSSTCSGAGAVATASSVAVTALNAAGPITVTIPQTSLAAALGANGVTPVYVCYGVDGTHTIPSSQFTAEGRVVKAAINAQNSEQDDICNGALTALGGSIKIDVRNYISSADSASNWQSAIRLINPSETKTADIEVQLINQDGSYGNWAQLASLPPRAVANYNASDIDTCLAGTAPLVVSSATVFKGCVKGAQATGTLGSTSAKPVAASAAGSSPRLRFTSQQGDTLRVQNYAINKNGTSTFEMSNSEGVDFAGGTNATDISRAPIQDGQFVTQDAQKGIDGQ